MVWYDMILYDICYDMIWYDMIWYDMIWYDMIWYDMIYEILYDIIQYNKYKNKNESLYFRKIETIYFVLVTCPVQLGTRTILFSWETNLKNNTVIQDFNPNDVKPAVFTAPYNFGFASGLKMRQRNWWNFSEIKFYKKQLVTSDWRVLF